MAKRQRTWKRKSKALRKSLKMWAEGAREDVLRPHIEPYTDALERGWRAERDYIQKVCNQYHAQISWRLLDHEEPDSPLPAYDPFAPPVVEKLTEDEAKARHQRHQELNKRIQRWLKYRARSLRNKGLSKAALRDNPYAVLLGKLSGLTSPPKARQAFQQFMRERPADVAAEVDKQWAKKSIAEDGSANTKHPGAPFRCKIARELFSALPQAEQDAIRGRAAAEAKQAKLDYATAMEGGASKSPEARQKCIDNFGRFMAPIMRGVQEYTGLQGFVVMGGPMPRFNGAIQTLHLSVGSNLTAVPSTFPGWDKSRWSRGVTEFYMDFLRTAYTAEDCAEAALPTATLNDAQYTMDPDSDSGSDSDSDSDAESDSANSESSSSSDSEGNASDDEGKKKSHKKKEKKASKKASKKSKNKGKKRKSEEGAGGGKRKRAKTGASASEETEKETETETETEAEKEAREAEERRLEAARHNGPHAATVHMAAPAQETVGMRARPRPRFAGGKAKGGGAPAVVGSSTNAESVPENEGDSDGRVPSASSGQHAQSMVGGTAAQAAKGRARWAARRRAALLPCTPLSRVARRRAGRSWREEVADLGPRYRELLDEFIALERSYDFVLGTGALKAPGRPSQVQQWIRDGRGRTQAVRAIPNIDQFASQWWIWWSALQPAWRGAWRGRKGGPQAVPENADWGLLAVPGQNGVLSVVATLYWWGCAEKAKGIASRSAGWEEAALDTIWVLRGLRGTGLQEIHT
ncbi:hypothetical protein DFH06DRAFT_973383 [Mycena polygramma]|nr:hypothetical protein DFH06DRAFT_973383 [Mycena polygramma]